LSNAKVDQNKIIYRETFPGWIDSWLGALYLSFIHL